MSAAFSQLNCSGWQPRRLVAAKRCWKHWLQRLSSEPLSVSAVCSSIGSISKWYWNNCKCYQFLSPLDVSN